MVVVQCAHNWCLYSQSQCSLVLYCKWLYINMQCFLCDNTVKPTTLNLIIHSSFYFYFFVFVPCHLLNFHFLLLFTVLKCSDELWLSFFIDRNSLLDNLVKWNTRWGNNLIMEKTCRVAHPVCLFYFYLFLAWNKKFWWEFWLLACSDSTDISLFCLSHVQCTVCRC